MRRRLPAIALAVGLAGCASPPANSPSQATASPSTIPSTVSPRAAASPGGPPTFALEDRMAAQVAIGGADFPIAAFGSLWVVSQDQPEPAIARVDPATHEVIATIKVDGRGCQGMVAAFGSVWACTNSGIARIDPATNRVIRVLDVPAVGQTRLAAGDDSVWAIGRASAAGPANPLLRIDPRTEEAEVIPTGHAAGQMAYAFHALWVTSPADGLLLRVDPATGEIATAAKGLDMPYGITAGMGSLWVTLAGEPDGSTASDAVTILRLDPRTLEVQGQIAAGPMSTIGEVAVGDDGIWVRNATTFLVRYDPETYEPMEIIEAAKGGGAVLLAYDAVWATSYNFNTLWRFDPEPGG
ncbi:MAG TPA: hypothetical protein VFY43_04170 [Candidatus Limnocylindria bacterium]|nr:hypothetical protein [Candidatus Limnocylindria bacterium]